MDSEIKKQLTSPTPVPDLVALISDKNIPKIYGNGFSAGLSLSDATLIIQMGPVPVALLNMSFTTLKTLSITINDLIEQVEQTTGEPLKGIQDIKKNLQ